MRRFLLAGIALPLLMAPAFSQSSSTPPTTAPGLMNAPGRSGAQGTANPMPPRTGQAVTPGSSTMPSTPAPMMTPGTTTATTPPAMMTTPGTTSAPGSQGMTTTPGSPAGLAAGANSFTENQARTRLMERGYTAVSTLKKDKDGVWRGTATKDAKSVAVGVDYKGVISGG